MNPLISIVIPVYNNEKEIGRCLDSVLMQTCAEIEIIVVDDGSIDNSGNIINKYAHDFPQKIKIFHKQNGGVTSARLYGIEKASGEWIGFVDGDDKVEKDMYELLLANAIKYDAQISHCGYQMMFEDGRVNHFYNTGRLVLQDRERGIKDLIEGVFIEPGLCNKLFHKKLLHDLICKKVMPKDIKINEDLLMNYYLFSGANKAIFEDKCKYHYMVRNNSASRQTLNANKIFDPIKVKQIIVDSIDDDLKDIAYRAYMSTCVNVYNSMMFVKKKSFCEEKEWVRQELIQRSNWKYYLSKKQRILRTMIIYIPYLYPYIYRIYARYVMKSPYS